MLQNIYGGNVR
ncbi:Protein of unknown function [Bacillus cereus]|nr:Protein of unknown function [Bacillus cereus]